MYAQALEVDWDVKLERGSWSGTRLEKKALHTVYKSWLLSQRQCGISYSREGYPEGKGGGEQEGGKGESLSLLITERSVSGPPKKNALVYFILAWLNNQVASYRRLFGLCFLKTNNLRPTVFHGILNHMFDSTCESWTIKRQNAKKLMPSNFSAGEDSWKSLGKQGDQTS